MRRFESSLPRHITLSYLKSAFALFLIFSKNKKIIKLSSLIISVAATATVISCDSGTNNSPESDNNSSLSSTKTKSQEEITQLINDLKTSKPTLTDLLEFKNESFNEEIDKLTTAKTVEDFVNEAKKI